MDNITHTFVGLGVGELIQRSLLPEASNARHQTRHRLLLTACALASNFPDLDLVLTHQLPPPLGYLLHHRGHTHTLLYLLPQAMLLLAVLWALWPNARMLLRESRPARTGLFLATAAGLLLHITMDFLNSYGVHPFYPFEPDWYYGDMVFIVEPVFWVAFGVPLALSIHSRARWVLVAGLFAALAYFAMHGFLNWGSFEALAALGGAIAVLRIMHMHSRRALALALAICVAFVGVQFAASQAGRAQLTRHLATLDPSSRVVDIAMTAFPAQPLCWSYASVEANEAAATYRLRRGTISIAPGWLPVEGCPPALQSRGGGESHWEGSLATLRELAAGNCELNAWLRFARIPQVDREVASDQRFAATPRGNFTTLEMADPGKRACPQGVPQWGMPRADLLAGAGGRH
ncbi:metal-dependent hydrolase [Pseudoduganella sp. UC29_106]|uniref:metal-dependent hydrolase n=1 Tax=Pseudoduganella sp. UC29_106 TaxID=3374553 RepID=UPI003757FC41